MNLFKMISATTLAVTVMAVMASPVSADSVTNEQNCNNSGAYGQVTCKIDTTINQGDKKVVRKSICDEYETRKDGTKVCVHKAANTALDTNSMVVALGTMLTGAAGVVVKIKNRA